MKKHHDVYTAQRRLFERIADMVPGVVSGRIGQAWVSRPRKAGDYAVYCEITGRAGGAVTIEMAHDGMVEPGVPAPRPLYILTLQRDAARAHVVGYQDKWRFETAISDSGVANPNAAQIDLMALSWLQTLINFGLTFTADLATTTVA